MLIASYQDGGMMSDVGKPTSTAEAVGGFVGLVSLIWIMSLVTCHGGSNTSSSADIHASIMCQEAVKAKLRDPSSADFGGYLNVSTMNDEGPVLTTTLTVNAANGFGGKSQARFSCSYDKESGAATVNELPN